MNANILSLQEQVDSLFSSLNALRGSYESNEPLHHEPESRYRHSSLAQSTPQSLYRNSLSPSQPRDKHPRFQGPTSSAFNFDVANSSLQTMGITDGDSTDEAIMNYGNAPFSLPGQSLPGVASMIAQASKDPLWKLRKDEAIRLCGVYEEEIGIMFPMFDMEKMTSKVELLFALNESIVSTGATNYNLNGLESIDTDDAHILKMVLATTLIVEGSGESELGRMLFDSVREVSESRLWEPVEIKGLILLVIVVRAYEAPTSIYSDHLYRQYIISI